MTSTIRRALVLVILIVLILTAPYWIYVPLLIIALVLVPVFWEGIMLTFLIDTIYATPPTVWYDFPHAFLACALVLATIPLRKMVRINA